MRTVALYNLGCKVNAYELDAMGELLTAAGYEIVPFGEAADIYLINTCTVTNMADHKSRQMLHRARALNPDSVVVAAGCYVQTGDAGKEDVDILVGNDQKRDIVPILERYFEGKGLAAPENMSNARQYEKLFITRTNEHTRAFVKVQDGCDQYCAYCIIPYARGHVRSRAPEDAAEEIRKLAEGGYREIVLTGIHLSSYGTDFEDSDLGPHVNLLRLIELACAVPGIRRVRLGSLEPRVITPEFLEGLRKQDKICPHFHLSLQSGCDSTLRRMNRKYTAEEYRESCERIRAVWPNAALTTDVITGFPGETEEEFRESKEFVESIHFFETHIFKYSRREGTRAAAMAGQIPEKRKSLRSGELIAMGRANKAAFLNIFIGSEIEILLEEEQEIDGITYMTGYSREYARCAVRGIFSETGAERGSVVRAAAEDILNSEMLICIITGIILQ